MAKKSQNTPETSEIRQTGRKLPLGYKLTPEPRTVRVAAVVGESTAAELKRQSKRDDMSLNEIFNQALLEYLMEHENDDKAVPDQENRRKN